MSTVLQNIKKSASFTKYLSPDKSIPTIQAAQSASDESVRVDRTVYGSFTWVKPEARKEYKLRWVSPAALDAIGLDPTEAETELFKETVSGQTVFVDEDAGVFPYAQNYAGYQFGHWAGQLGDGRAISLFEATNPKSGERYELQLKGAGLTPYSRFADGKAVLRSSIREALASEAVHALGIPTTRALALVELPGTLARRERHETAAIVARMAPSWVRFGTFDLHHSRDDRDEVRKLADYCISEVYKDEPKRLASGDKNRYYEFWKAACLRNAKMVGLTQAYGFLNGVLNTDNTSILGLSLDYGPFAFMDTFDFLFTPNHDDYENRYGFQNSPTMLWWNCVRFAECLGELMGQGSNVDKDEFVAKGTLDADKEKVQELATSLIMDLGPEFEKEYKKVWVSQLRKRLGLTTEKESDEKDLIHPLLKTMYDCELDYNGFFRKLGSQKFFGGQGVDPSIFLPKDRGITAKLNDKDAKENIDGWLALYAARLEEEKNIDDEARRVRSNKVNPHFVLKNWVLSDVIAKAEQGNWEPFNAVAVMALSPFEESWSVGFEEYLADGPFETRKDTCSCSS